MYTLLALHVQNSTFFFFLFVRIDDYYFIEYFIDLNDEIIIGSKVIENDSMADTEDGRES